jgi:phosphoserine phosphatase RsbU/P
MVSTKILIVDDEQFNIDYLEQELEDQDLITISALNGKIALEKSEKEQPDLILLDIMMPEMDGFKVLSGLKGNPLTSNIPVVIISAANSMDNIIKGIQMGAEDYLPKPFEPMLLKARISSCLEKKRLHDLETMYLKRLEGEMNIARDIQAGFLPSSIPEVDGWDIGAYFKAAKEVAGDFYDIFFLPDGQLVAMLGDVCGKGVGAALFMALFRSLLRATCLSKAFQGIGCNEAINNSERLKSAVLFTNNYVAETHTDDNMFATLFVCIVNPIDGKVTYINCGNEPPIVFHKLENATISLPPTGPVIGLFPDCEIRTQEFDLLKGDLLIAYTDGIPDSINIQNESFGIERIHQLVFKDSTSAAGLVSEIERDVTNHISNTDQFDDISLLIIRRNHM